ncbi:protein kinase domain-containing protein [Deinococcus radiophilus]|uniref:protein kinase domain-containing protein n=1 Tax=Deinococcus radiophilus TaxID=32062 RepID=UPI003617FADA
MLGLFEREAAVAARLHHPQLPELLARSKRQLIFGWRDGLLLRTILSVPPPGGLDLCATLRLGLGILTGLEHLHGRGVVHQDLKPDNLLLSGWAAYEPLRPQQVILLDFDQSWAADLADVAPGVRMGTPHYMAPEQFSGVRGDPRSDLYSLGAVLYEALSGEPPYPQPLPWLLGQTAVRQDWPGPAPVVELLAALLDPHPAARPATAQAAAEWLRVVAKQLDLGLG